MPSTTACSSSQAAIAIGTWRLTLSFSRPSSQARRTAKPPPATSARDEPAISSGAPRRARGCRERRVGASSELRQAEFASEKDGYTATPHQREVGTGYFDAVAQAVSGGAPRTGALGETTEARQ